MNSKSDTIDAEIDEILKMAKSILLSQDIGDWSYATTIEQDRAKVKSLLRRERQAVLLKVWNAYVEQPGVSAEVLVEELSNELSRLSGDSHE